MENYIRQLIETHRSNQVTVAWQGSEPTLMGVDFYRKAIDYQEKYRGPGMSFENTMQTNGTLLLDRLAYRGRISIQVQSARPLKTT